MQAIATRFRCFDRGDLQRGWPTERLGRGPICARLLAMLRSGKQGCHQGIFDAKDPNFARLQRPRQRWSGRGHSTNSLGNPIAQYGHPKLPPTCTSLKTRLLLKMPICACTTPSDARKLL